MAHLLHVHIVDDDGVGLVPDSLAESAWATNFNNTVNGAVTVYTPGTPCRLHFFSNIDSLNTFLAATAVPAEHTATFDAWKTANSITVTYELFDLASSATDISGTAKY